MTDLLYMIQMPASYCLSQQLNDWLVVYDTDARLVLFESATGWMSCCIWHICQPSIVWVSNQMTDLLYMTQMLTLYCLSQQPDDWLVVYETYARQALPWSAHWSLAYCIWRWCQHNDHWLVVSGTSWCNTLINGWLTINDNNDWQCKDQNLDFWFMTLIPDWHISLVQLHCFVRYKPTREL